MQYLQFAAPIAGYGGPIGGHYNLSSNHIDRHSNQNTGEGQVDIQIWKRNQEMSKTTACLARD